MIDWLKKRLTIAKQGSLRWKELAEALQEFWAEQFDPEISEAKNLSSIYTAGLADQRRIASELGRYFETELPDENIPICIAQRKIELAQKDTIVPIQATLRRMGVDAEWCPLYGKSGEMYGKAFYLKDQLDPAWIDNISPKLDGTWAVGSTPAVPMLSSAYLTSRGMLRIDLSTIQNDAAMLAVFSRVRQIKPLHIVFDGVYFWIYLEIFINILVLSSLGVFINQPVHYPWCSPRLDGSWAIGRDAFFIPLSGRLDGSWRVGQKEPAVAYQVLRQCNIASSVISKINAERPARYITVTLSYPMLRLDGSWRVGRNQILALAAGPRVLVLAETDTKASLGTFHSTSMPIGYPASPSKLTSIPKLYRRHLNGRWALGTPKRTMRVNGAWRIRTVGIRSQAEQRQTVHGRFGISPRLATATSRLGQWSARPLNGAWHVGAYHNLDGSWRLSNRNRLAAPKIGNFYRKLDGGWTLGFTKKLDGGWKVGFTGPDCIAEIVVRRMA